MAISPCRALGTHHPASAKAALWGGVGSVGPTSAPLSARLLTLAPKPSPRPHLSGAQQTSAGRWVSCACGSVGGGPCCGVSGVPAQKALPLGPDWLGPPGAPANGSRCAAGNVAGRRAGVGADDPRLRRPPPALGADASTQAAGATHSGRVSDSGF